MNEFEFGICIRAASIALIAFCFYLLARSIYNEGLEKKQRGVWVKQPDGVNKVYIAHKDKITGNIEICIGSLFGQNAWVKLLQNGTLKWENNIVKWKIYDVNKFIYKTEIQLT